MKDKLLKLFPIAKIDEATHMVYGVATSEAPDSDDEIADYPASKAAIQQWSADQLKKTLAAGQEPSMGNIRLMHQLQIGGKAVQINYDDTAKTVSVGSVPANDDVWHLIKGGFLTMYSIGGGYAWKKAEGKYTRYGPEIAEISFVDRGANPDATFLYVKADGTTEMRKCQKPGPAEKALLEKVRGELEKGVKYLVPDGNHLPYTDESGKPNHRLMGAAWAALHQGYRGNEYSGPDKEGAISRLKHIYQQEGMDTPSEKARVALVAFGVPDSDLDTYLAKISDLLAEEMRQIAETEETLKPEQIKKCAEALGITEAEFVKLYDADVLAKGKKGIAAVAAHVKKAMAHCEKMAAHHTKIVDAHRIAGEMHKAHAEHHATMSEHLDNIHKALDAHMDSDGDYDGDKGKRAAELEKGKEPITITNLDLAELIKSQIATALDEFKKTLPVDEKTGKVVTIPRTDGEAGKDQVKKAAAGSAGAAIPV